MPFYRGSAPEFPMLQVAFPFQRRPLIVRHARAIRETPTHYFIGIVEKMIAEGTVLSVNGGAIRINWDSAQVLPVYNLERHCS